MSVLAVVLACGDSKRFRPQYEYPKQFVHFAMEGGFQDQMYRHVLHGYECGKKVVITLLKYESYLDVLLDGQWGAYFVERSNGQAETVMRAINLIGIRPAFSGYLFVNCDNGFAPGVLDRLVNYCEEWDRPGALTMQVHQDEEKRWSFVDGHPRFYNAYEKRCVHMVNQRPRALCGAYYFPLKYVPMLELACLGVVGTCRDREPQMSEVLSHINAPLLSVNCDRNEFYDWGTPQSFRSFLERDQKVRS